MKYEVYYRFEGLKRFYVEAEDEFEARSKVEYSHEYNMFPDECISDSNAIIDSVEFACVDEACDED